MNTKALLVVDMQAGNFSKSDPIYKGDELLSKVKKLIEKAHSKDQLVIFIQNNGGVGDPDEYGTPGWSIHSLLLPSEVFVSNSILWPSKELHLNPISIPSFIPLSQVFLMS